MKRTKIEILEILAKFVLVAYLAFMTGAYVGYHAQKNDLIELFESAGWSSNKFDDCECWYSPDLTVQVEIGNMEK